MDYQPKMKMTRLEACSPPGIEVEQSEQTKGQTRKEKARSTSVFGLVVPSTARYLFSFQCTVGVVIILRVIRLYRPLATNCLCNQKRCPNAATQKVYSASTLYIFNPLGCCCCQWCILPQ